MKYDCNIICDLLPLYIDGACSKQSSEMIEQHLRECKSCSILCEDMRASEKQIDVQIQKERDEVLSTQVKYFRKKSFLAGSIIAGIFAIPILACLIVNLASGAGLSWFFIVLAAMLVPASVTIVPLMVPEKKGLWTFGSFCGSLTILLAVCSIYSGSSWFFVAFAALLVLASLTAVPVLVPKNKALWTLGSFTASLILLLGVTCIFAGGSWFFIAASSVLFGLSVPFAPCVINSQVFKKYIRKHRALVAAAVWTVTFVLMMLCIGISADSKDFLRWSMACSIPPFAYLWSIVCVISLLHCNAKLKAAACIFITSLFIIISRPIATLILGNGLSFPRFDPASSDINVLAETAGWMLFAVGTVTAAVFGALGLKEHKNTK